MVTLDWRNIFHKVRSVKGALRQFAVTFYLKNCHMSKTWSFWNICCTNININMWRIILFYLKKNSNILLVINDWMDWMKSNAKTAWNSEGHSNSNTVVLRCTYVLNIIVLSNNTFPWVELSKLSIYSNSIIYKRYYI